MKSKLKNHIVFPACKFGQNKTVELQKVLELYVTSYSR